jgi:formylglycine-generating enzyme required for sulfatase activity
MATLPIAVLLASTTLPAQPAPGDMVNIPSGAFIMGSNQGPADEAPAHEVSVRDYAIDRFPVTNAQFADFLNAVIKPGSGERLYDFDDPDARIHMRGGRYLADSGYETHPVNEVPWGGAVAYCKWQGKRLPTEAEWEKAARGTDARRYPWGNDLPDARRARYGAGWNQTAPVHATSGGASPYGVRDLAGNVWEWVSSAYRPYPYRADDGREDLTPGAVRSTRGGGHGSNADELTTTHRGRHVSRNPASGHHNIGFRCAR